MKNLIYILFFMLLSASAMSQNSGTGSSSQAISADKNTVATTRNNAVQISAEAVPFSEKERIVQSYPRYHTAVTSGNDKSVKAIEVNMQAERPNNNQSNSTKKAVVTGQTKSREEVQSIEVSQKAVKVQ